jgi:hypothetical protein
VVEAADRINLRPDEVITLARVRDHFGIDLVPAAVKGGSDYELPRRANPGGPWRGVSSVDAMGGLWRESRIDAFNRDPIGQADRFVDSMIKHTYKHHVTVVDLWDAPPAIREQLQGRIMDRMGSGVSGKKSLTQGMMDKILPIGF